MIYQLATFHFEKRINSKSRSFLHKSAFLNENINNW